MFLPSPAARVQPAPASPLPWRRRRTRLGLPRRAPPVLGGSIPPRTTARRLSGLRLRMFKRCCHGQWPWAAARHRGSCDPAAGSANGRLGLGPAQRFGGRSGLRSAPLPDLALRLALATLVGFGHVLSIGPFVAKIRQIRHRICYVRHKSLRFATFGGTSCDSDDVTRVGQTHREFVPSSFRRPIIGGSSCQDECCCGRNQPKNATCCHFRRRSCLSLFWLNLATCCHLRHFYCIVCFGPPACRRRTPAHTNPCSHIREAAGIRSPPDGRSAT